MNSDQIAANIARCCIPEQAARMARAMEAGSRLTLVRCDDGYVEVSVDGTVYRRPRHVWNGRARGPGSLSIEEDRPKARPHPVELIDEE